jgi:hypothetical protein
MVFEYVPTNPINQLEMWQAETFDPKQIDSEGQTHRSCELIPAKQKHFAQRRRAAEWTRKTRQLFISNPCVSAPLRLCASSIIFS